VQRSNCCFSVSTFLLCERDYNVVSVVIATLPTKSCHPTIWSLVHSDPISVLRLDQTTEKQNVVSRPLKLLHALNLTKLNKPSVTPLVIQQMLPLYLQVANRFRQEGEVVPSMVNDFGLYVERYFHRMICWFTISLFFPV
jgi:hypothetical protein